MENEFTASPQDVKIIREIEARGRQIEEATAEIANLKAAQAVSINAEGIPGVDQAAPPAVTPDPVLSNEQVEVRAKAMVDADRQATAFAQTVANFTVDPETAIDLLKLRGVEIAFEDGQPRLMLGGELVPIDGESLARAGVSSFLIRSAGAQGSGARPVREADGAGGETLFQVKQKALSDFTYYRHNRDRILALRREGKI